MKTAGTGSGGDKKTAIYPPIFNPPILEIEPCIVTDMDGKILTWYLPNILNESRAVCNSLPSSVRPN